MTENIMEGLQTSIEASLAQMAQAKELNQRKIISETIRNLTESMTSFLGIATDLQESIFDSDFDMFEGEDEGADGAPFLR